MEILTKDIGNYIIYSDGRVWSKFRNRFRNPSIDKNGYYRLILEGKSKSLHRVIAECFLSKPDQKANHVDHINNNKLDNRVENLRWCTREDNTKWAREDGLYKKGLDQWKSKLKESDVIEIYNNPNKLSSVELGRQFNVRHSTINYIQNNKIWTHITKDLTPGFRKDGRRRSLSS